MTEKYKKFEVKENICISCGACVSICPKVFKFNEKNKAFVYHQPNNEEEVECASSAERICPVKAIISDKNLN